MRLIACLESQTFVSLSPIKIIKVFLWVGIRAFCRSFSVDRVPESGKNTREGGKVLITLETSFYPVINTLYSVTCLFS